MRISVICTLLQRKYYSKMNLQVSCFLITLWIFLVFCVIGVHLDQNRDEFYEFISNLDDVPMEYREMVLEFYEQFYLACIKVVSVFTVLCLIETCLMILFVLNKILHILPVVIIVIGIGITILIV